MAFTTKLNLNNSKFTQTGTLELGGTNNFTGTVNLTGATVVNTDGSTLIIDGQAFNNYTGNTTTASNGLTLVGEEVILGGTLTGDTFVNTSTNNISITGVTSAGHTSGMVVKNSTTVADAQFGTLSSSFDYLGIVSNSSDVGMVRQNLIGGTAQQIAFTSSAMYVNDTLNDTGLEYGDDYSTSGVTNPRWIPDYAAVQAAVTSGVSADNGLSVQSGNVVLGGTLTGDTTVDTDGYSIQMGNLTTNSTNNAFVIGYCTGVYGSQSFASGFRTSAYGPNSRAGGYGYTGGKTIFACGNTSFIHSENTTSQTASHGANAHNSAILGGIDHNIGSGNVRAAIIGGNAIKLTGTSYIDHTAVANLAIFTTPTDDANGEVLVWDSATKKVGKTTIAALGGLSGATNGLSTSGNDAILGGTLDQNTTIAAAGYSMTINNTSDLTLGNNGNMELSTTGASATLDINGKTNSQVVIKSQSGTVAGDDFTNGIGFNLDYNANLFSVTDNRATAAGLQYVADYSLDYTNRSLVDKAYVDAIASGLDAKDASIVATTSSDGNIDLTGGTFVSGSTIDGVVVGDTWRVLIKNQTNAVENGIYDYSASASGFTRSEDFDGNPTGEVSQGSFTFIVTGDTLSSTSWLVTTPDPITVGTTEINFTIAARSFDLIEGTGTTVSVVGGNRSVSVELSTNSGLDFDAAGTAGRLRVASSFAGLGSTLGSGVLDLNVTDTTASGSEVAVQIDSSGTDVLYIDSDDISSVITANNGLTKTGDNIHLGGTLTGSTTITQGTGNVLTFNFDGASGCGYTTVTPDSGVNTHISAASNGTYTLNGQFGNFTRMLHTGDYFTTYNEVCVSTGGAHLFGNGLYGSSSVNADHCGTSYNAYGNSIPHIKICADDNQSFGYSVMDISGVETKIIHTHTGSSSQSSITFGEAAITVSDAIESKGLVYDADYSTSGSTDPRWIPDYAAVTGLTSAAGTTANNGITKVGQNFVLGGTLTGDTTVDTSTNQLYLTGTSAAGDTGGLLINNDVAVAKTQLGVLSDFVQRGFYASCSNTSIINLDFTGGTQQQLSITDVSMFIADTKNEIGVEYAADYSTSGVTNPRWIPDYAAVQAAVTSGVSADNGLSVQSGNVVLGGTLTGDTTVDTGIFSMAFGKSTTVSATGGTYGSFAIGYGAVATSAGAATAIGYDTCALGYYSTAVGYATCAWGYKSTAIGSNGVATGTESMAIGYGGNASGTHSLSLGGHAVGTCSVASNQEAYACGNNSTVMSHQSIAHATSSGIFAGRCNTIAIGNTCAVVIGGYQINLTGTSYVDTTAVDHLAIMSTPAVGTTSDSVLVRNSSTGIVKTVAGSELGDANNVYDITGITSATLTTAEYVVLVETSGATQTVTLPASPVDGQAYKIKDKGNALTNSITVSGNGNNIDGAANATINTDYGALELVYSLSDTEWYSLAFIN